MKPEQFKAETAKYMSLTGATKSDIRRATGWSEATMRRRFDHPETITLGEAHEISSFLGIKIKIN